MTPNHTNPVPPPAAGLDRLLSDFFQNELPRPWPRPPAATAEPSSLARGRADVGNRSRYTLAASVALLLGLGVYLSSGTPAESQSPKAAALDTGKAASDGGNLLKGANPMHGGEHPMGVPNMP